MIWVGWTGRFIILSDFVVLVILSDLWWARMLIVRILGVLLGRRDCNYMGGILYQQQKQ